MINGLIIRAERPEDRHETELMTMRSFWNKYGPGCSEHNMIRIIRRSKDYLSSISRIAEADGRIAGAVYYTKALIDDGAVKREVALLGPLAVEPTLEGNDIGGTLIRETVRLAKEECIPGIILVGEPGYYPKFGFRHMSEFGITDPDGNCRNAYFCLPLNESFSACRGVFLESEDFGMIEDGKMLEEIAKEFPAYRKVKVQEGFMQIFEQHLGVVDSVEGDLYRVRYWELTIPAVLSEDLTEKPVPGSDVQFDWNHRGTSTITKVLKNLLEP